MRQRQGRHDDRLRDPRLTEPKTTIRAGSVEDARAIASVHVAAWQAAYTGLLKAEIIQERNLARREEQWTRHFNEDPVDERVWVALLEDEVVGFAATRPSPDTDLDPSVHELTALYLVRSAWGRGIGTGLLTSAQDDLRSAGVARASLWVLEGNQRARNFYESHGWTFDKHEPNYPGFEASGLRYLKDLGI